MNNIPILCFHAKYVFLSSRFAFSLAEFALKGYRAQMDTDGKFERRRGLIQVLFHASCNTLPIRYQIPMQGAHTSMSIGW